MCVMVEDIECARARAVLLSIIAGESQAILSGITEFCDSM